MYFQDILMSAYMPHPFMLLFALFAKSDSTQTCARNFFLKGVNVAAAQCVKNAQARQQSPKVPISGQRYETEPMTCIKLNSHKLLYSHVGIETFGMNTI
jgi:hypothetical protein